jgi:two-component system chemotaxis response regulator CheB
VARDLVVIGASAGGLPALATILGALTRRGRLRTEVILSGALDDGSYGLGAIVSRGGAAIVQDPDDAAVPAMPLAALRQIRVEAVLPAAAIAAAIERFCGAPARAEVTPMPRAEVREPQRPAADSSVANMQERLGRPSAITCPACGGTLWETDENGVAATPATSVTSTALTAS